MVSKARERVGIQDHGSVAGEGRQDLLPHLRPNAAPGAENDGISAPVSQKLTQFGRAIDRADHYGEAFSSVDGQGLPGAGNGHQARARSQGAPCS